MQSHVALTADTLCLCGVVSWHPFSHHPNWNPPSWNFCILFRRSESWHIFHEVFTSFILCLHKSACSASIFHQLGILTLIMASRNRCTRHCNNDKALVLWCLLAGGGPRQMNTIRDDIWGRKRKKVVVVEEAVFKASGLHVEARLALLSAD